MNIQDKEKKLQELREFYKKTTDPIARRIIIVRAELLKRSFDKTYEHLS